MGIKVRSMSSHYGLNKLGYTCATLMIDNEKQWREPEQIFKRHLSLDCSLKLKSMKPESLVIVNHYVTVNSYPSLVHTARHAMETMLGRSCVVVSCVIFS